MSQHLLKQTVRNSFFSGISTVSMFVISLLFAGFRIRLLGLERTGFMMLVESIIALTASVGGFGFGTAAIRRIAVFHGEKRFTEIRTCLGAVLLVSTVIGLFVATVFPVGFPWIFEWSRISSEFRVDAFYAIILLGMSFFIRQIFTTYEVTYSALQRYDLIALINSIFGFLTGGLGLFVLMVLPTMTALAGLSLGLALIHTVVSFLVVRRLVHRAVLPVLNLPELRSMIRFGRWAYIGSLGSLLTNGVDKILLTTFMGSALLPYYVIGQRVVRQVHIALTGQSQFIFPMLAAEGERTSIVIKQVEDRLRWFTAFASATVYGALAAVAYPLLAKLVGVAFAEIALIPFQLACLQGILVSLSIVPYYTSWAEGKGAPNAVIIWITGISVFGTMMILIPRMGVIGASIAQLWIGVTSLLLVYWVAETRDSFTWWGMLRPLISPTFIVLGFWLVSRIAWALHDQGWISFVAVIGTGGALSVGIGLFIEHWFFDKYRCLSTLQRALTVVFERFRGSFFL